MPIKTTTKYHKADSCSPRLHFECFQTLIEGKNSVTQTSPEQRNYCPTLNEASRILRTKPDGTFHEGKVQGDFIHPQRWKIPKWYMNSPLSIWVYSGNRERLNITKSSNSGNSLVAQWLGLPKAWVQSLAWELRSHKPGNAAKQKQTLRRCNPLC